MTDNAPETKKKFRPFRALFRFFAALLLLVYVIMGASAAFTFFQLTLNRIQDIKELPYIIQSAVLNNRLEKVEAWVRLRPASETDALIEAITPAAGDLGPKVFLDLSQRELQRGRKEEALFWAQYARFRYRFDVLRCGIAQANDVIGGLMEDFSPPEIDVLLRQQPELVKKSVQRVLDFDSQHPAQNKPDLTCTASSRMTQVDAQPVSSDQWDAVRNFMRRTTEIFLQEDNGKK